MSDINVHASPEAVNMIAAALGLDKAEAEKALSAIAAAVTKDNTETEADNGT